jgi:hypothetical protein
MSLTNKIVVHYTPPVPATEAIADLHDQFHGLGYDLSRARRRKDAPECDRIEAESAAIAARIDALNAAEKAKGA